MCAVPGAAQDLPVDALAPPDPERRRPSAGAPLDPQVVSRSQLQQLSVNAKSPSESETEMVQVVLPNDANPLGFILGGTVMHLIDIAGAIASHRHTRTLLV